MLAHEGSVPVCCSGYLVFTREGSVQIGMEDPHDNMCVGVFVMCGWVYITMCVWVYFSEDIGCWHVKAVRG